MIHSPNKPGRPFRGDQVWTALLTADQVEALKSAAQARGPKQGNAVLRDVVDFWRDHQALFLTWLAQRGK